MGTVPNYNATQVALYGTISADASVYLAEAPDAAISPCQDQGYRLWLTADGILDPQGLSAGAVWAVCYNETDGVGYDAGIRVRRSRVVQVSGHTVGMFVTGGVLFDSWNLEPEAFSNLSAPAETTSRNQHPHWWAGTKESYWDRLAADRTPGGALLGVSSPNKTLSELQNLTLVQAYRTGPFGASPCSDDLFTTDTVAFTASDLWDSFELRADTFDRGQVWAMCYMTSDLNGTRWADSFARYLVRDSVATDAHAVLGAFNHFKYTMRLESD